MRPLRRLRSIEDKRDRLLAWVERLDPELVTTPPAPGKWSIHEIVEHLVLAEESVMGNVSSLDERAPRRRRLRGRLLYWLVMFILRFRIPVEVPDSSMLPSGELSLDEIRARWTRNHARLRHWLEGLSADDARKAYFRHPVVGGMTAAQSLLMLDVHLDRHIRKMRAMVDAARPKNLEEREA